jgi:hypothetical protein
MRQRLSLTSAWADFFLVNRHSIRLSVLILAIVIQPISYLIGSGVFFSSEQAKQIAESVSDPVSCHTIALHNMRVSVFGFVPILGVGWQSWVSFNTGIVGKALAITHNLTPNCLLWMIANFPHYWFETIAVALPATAGMMFLLGLSTRRRSVVLHELKCVGGSLVVWVLLLIVASLLEKWGFAPVLWIPLIPIIVGIARLDKENWGYSDRLTFGIIIFLYVSFFLRFNCFNLFPIAFLGFLSLPLLKRLYGLVAIIGKKKETGKVKA